MEKNVSAQHESMCVPFVLSFASGVPVKDIILKLADQNRTGRVKRGWYDSEYMPVAARLGIVFGNRSYLRNDVRIHDILRYYPELKDGSYFVIVKGHIVVLHNGMIFHNQQPNGVKPLHVLRNSRLMYYYRIDNCKGIVPYEASPIKALAKAPEAVRPNVQLYDVRVYPHPAMPSDTIASGQMGGRLVRIHVTDNYRLRTISVNGRLQRTANGTVALAVGSLKEKVKQYRISQS